MVLECLLQHGFIQAISISSRWLKKLNFLIESLNSILVKICFKHIGIELAFKINSLTRFLLSICHPDVKRPKFFRGFTSWTPTRAPPWTHCQAYSTSRSLDKSLQYSTIKINKKLNIFWLFGLTIMHM